MKSKFSAFASLILIFTTVLAKAKDCNCAEAFEKVIKVYEKDYALFTFKVSEDNKLLYAAHTDVFRDKVKNIKEEKECLTIMEQWLEFFRDGHTYIKIATENSRKKIKFDHQSFMLDLKKIQKSKLYKNSDLIGIWNNGSYDVAIIPDSANTLKGSFIGVVTSSKNTSWKPGEIRFQLNKIYGNDYEAVYYMDDNSPRKLKAKLKNERQLEFITQNIWTKVSGGKNASENKEDTNNQYGDFHLKLINGKIPYIRFPNFYEKEPAFVDSLLKSHHKDLVKAEFIIVDVRDNRGGNDSVYKSLLPYILSGPVKVPNMGLWMSEGNLELFLEGKDRAKLNDDEKAEFDYLMSLKNTFFYQDPEDFYTITPKELFSPQQKVVVLMNNKTISSGETFVFRAAQSEKVILYGQNTAGVVDGHNVVSRIVDGFNVNYPSAIRAKNIKDNAIDPYGIAPDVFISPELDALQYSIDHMTQYLKKQKDSPLKSK